MTTLDLNILAKYPFLKGAKEYVASLNLTPAAILNHPIYSTGINMAKLRVLDALNGRINPDMGDKISMELTILSYAIARILVNLTANKSIISKYAEVEANQAYEFMRTEEQDVIDVIMEDVGLMIRDNSSKNKIKFTEYLRLSTALARQNPRWKLVNRVVDSGYVDLGGGADEIPLLLREAIRLKIIAPVTLRGVPDRFRELANTIASTAFGGPRELDIKEMNKKALPPCILGMLASLEAGNASHNSMFILGTFFIGLGIRIDDILEICINS